jgi:hypothetical protein
MSLLHLLKAFESVKELPIEIPEIRDAVLGLGYQDEIVFVPGRDIDPGKLRGVYYQFTKRNGVYADPHLCTLIVYSSKLSIEWQRLVCAKEMIHIMDGKEEKTKTAEELLGLIDKLIGPLSTEDYGLADLMAGKDKLAVYQALAVLFPDGAREDALKQISEGATPQQIADQASVPLAFTRLVLLPAWPAAKKDICAL